MESKWLSSEMTEQWKHNCDWLWKKMSFVDRVTWTRALNFQSNALTTVIAFFSVSWFCKPYRKVNLVQGIQFGHGIMPAISEKMQHITACKSVIEESRVRKKQACWEKVTRIMSERIRYLSYFSLEENWHSRKILLSWNFYVKWIRLFVLKIKKRILFFFDVNTILSEMTPVWLSIEPYKPGVMISLAIFSLKICLPNISLRGSSM